MPKYYGKYGGVFMPELLIAPLQEMTNAWDEVKMSSSFLAKFHLILKKYAGRETPITEVERFSSAINGPRIILKREDLLHTGAHKLNNALGQCLFAQYYGKQRIIAETGAGQHGVATATACALLGLECVIYMGKVDMDRQAPNVTKMLLLGAQVRPVQQGTATLKETVNEAMRDWSSYYETTHYCLGSALGPYPYPEMVGFFQKIIGEEARTQMLAKFGCLPNSIIACVGGGSNAIGIFAPFLDDTQVRLIGIEAGGQSDILGMHAARFKGGRPGVLHGSFTYLLQDEEGQIAETRSVSAGLDYPAVGPQHADLFESGRAEYFSVNDKKALEALKLLSKMEGIIPALEPSHALAYLIDNAQSFKKEDIVLVNLSGRGDKDLPQLSKEGLL